MDVLETYAVSGFLDFLQGLVSAVPIGFLLGCFLGLLGFGVFGVFNLMRRLMSR